MTPSDALLKVIREFKGNDRRNFGSKQQHFELVIVSRTIKKPLSKAEFADRGRSYLGFKAEIHLGAYTKMFLDPKMLGCAAD